MISGGDLRVTDLGALRASYDDLAADYERIFPDWRESSRRQGAALDALISAEFPDRPGPRRVLDCAAGIGTQALALAELGHRVIASDVSFQALRRLVDGERARSSRLSSGAVVADMRTLPFADASAEVVICADNSLPHLLTGADVVAALREMRRVAVPGGLVLVSTRDYDELRRTRPGATPVQVSRDDAGLTATFQVWTWHDDGRHYDYEHLMLTGDGVGWKVGHRTGTYWALTQAELSALAVEAGLIGVRWLFRSRPASSSRYWSPAPEEGPRTLSWGPTCRKPPRGYGQPVGTLDYAGYGPLTDLSSVESMVLDVELGPVATSAVVAGLVVQPGALPDLPAGRVGEKNLRPADAIVRRLLSMDPSPLTQARPPDRRVVGTCRHFAVLACALLRRQGTPHGPGAGSPPTSGPVSPWTTGSSSTSPRTSAGSASTPEILGLDVVAHPEDLPPVRS